MYTLNSNIVIREEENFYLAYDCIKKVYYKLNSIAYIILLEAIEAKSRQGLINSVCKKTGDIPVAAEKDICEVIDNMVEMGILSDETN